MCSTQKLEMAAEADKSMPVKNVKSTTKMKRYMKDYCNASSIHGFQYLGEDRTIWEKIFWCIIFIVCLTSAAVMIYKIYEKYDQSPIIVSFATTETSIQDIPFPAVTICPEVKSVRKKLDYQDVLSRKRIGENLTESEQEHFDYISVVCDELEETTKYTSNNTDFNSSFFQYLDDVKLDFFNLAHKCKFLSTTYNCSDLFIPIITDEGICYSFNLLDKSQIFTGLVASYKHYHEAQSKSMSWNFEEGYIKNDLNVYPRRALLAGATNGLNIEIFTPADDVHFDCKEIQGFRALLHTPMRFPRLKQEYFRVPLDQSVIVAVQPTMITTSGAVKNYKPSKRKCAFPFERKLKYFTSYSQLNCQLECLTNFTVKQCGCVNFFMPRENGTKICGFQNHACLKASEGLGHKGNDFKQGQFDDANCNCLPLCTDLSYSAETSQTKLKRAKDNPKTTHTSRLTVYFKFNHFISSERNELYGPTDFLANFGGLLGLFTGFSILSFIEIIYFLTIRICFNMKLFKRWDGSAIEIISE